MSNQSTFSTSKFKKYLITASIDERAKLSARMFAALMFTGYVIPILLINYSHHKKSLLFIPISLLAGVAGAIIAYYLIRIVIQRPIVAAEEKRYEMIGKTLTNDEKIELYVWYKYGKLPHTKTLRPVLLNYTNYIESRLNGTYTDKYVGSKRYRWYSVVLGLLQIYLGVDNVLSSDHDYFIATISFIAGAAILALSVASVKRPLLVQRLAAKINQRQLNRITRMREQLKHA